MDSFGVRHFSVGNTRWPGVLQLGGCRGRLARDAFLEFTFSRVRKMHTIFVASQMYLLRNSSRNIGWNCTHHPESAEENHRGSFRNDALDKAING